MHGFAQPHTNKVYKKLSLWTKIFNPVKSVSFYVPSLVSNLSYYQNLDSFRRKERERGRINYTMEHTRQDIFTTIHKWQKVLPNSNL